MEKDLVEERSKVKNRRKNYTIAEKQVIIKAYERTSNLRETARKFDISPSTLSGWLANIEKIKDSNLKKTDYRNKGAGRKLDSDEYDEAIINFIKEARENEVAITSSEVILKAIEFIPSFKEKSYDSLHHWFKRFREKYIKIYVVSPSLQLFNFLITYL